MYIKKMVISAWLVMLLFVWTGGSLARAEVSASEGKFPLAAWDFTKDGIVGLDGEWEFYWNQLLSPEAFLQPATPSQTGLIRLPHSWNGYVTDSGELSGNGFATFRLTLQMPNAVGKLSLELPTMFTAYKLWVNGELVSSIGQVGKDRDHTVPSIATRIVEFQPIDGNNELVVQVANFHHLRGGMTKSILLGTNEQIRMRADKQEVLEMFVIGTLICMGVYHLVLFMMRTKDRAPLYFGIFSIIWGVRGLLVGQVVWTRVFPDFPWELQMKMEYLALYGGLFVFVVYLRHLFPGAMAPWFSRGSQLCFAIAAVPVIIAPARMYTHLLSWNEVVIGMQLLFMLYIIMKTFRQKREGALLLMWVGAFATITCINDFLYFAEIWPYFGSLSPFGLFVFTIGQMFILSRRFTGAFTMAEQYSAQLQKANRKLQQWNELLETRVTDRSRELSEANYHLNESYQKLSDVEASRKKLLSYITHDLRSSVTVIVGYAEALTDNIKPSLHAKFIHTIHSRAVFIDHMIDDLYLLSQLESKQIPFQFRINGICEYADRVYAKHQMSTEKADLQFILDMPDSMADVTVLADSERLERVFDNLIGNAIKFTPAGGTITVSFRIVQREDGELAERMKTAADMEVGTALDEGFPDREAERMNEWLKWNVLVEVADTGAGISGEDLPNIFERYYRGTENSKVGSGLGLAISKEIIERHHGRIWVESKTDKGSCFSFCLPVHSM